MAQRRATLIQFCASEPDVLDRKPSLATVLNVRRSSKTTSTSRKKGNKDEIKTKLQTRTYTYFISRLTQTCEIVQCYVLYTLFTYCTLCSHIVHSVHILYSFFTYCTECSHIVHRVHIWYTVFTYCTPCSHIVHRVHIHLL